MIGEACGLLRERSGLGTVALSGGVFQNLLLLGTVVDLEGWDSGCSRTPGSRRTTAGSAWARPWWPRPATGPGGWPELVALVQGYVAVTG